MLSKLDKLKSQATGNSKSGINTEFYFLAKELGCLPDLLGREYEVVYDDKGRISKVIQKPMSIPSFINLMKEMDKDYRNQQKQMRKAKRGKR